MQFSNNYNYPNNFSNTEDSGRFRFFDLAEMIANHGVKLLYGNGFILSSDIPEYKSCIEKWEKTIPFQKLFYEDFKIKSYWGYSIVTIDQSYSGQLILTFAQPYANSRVARYAENEQAADIWSRVKYDDTTGYMHTEYTKYDIRRQFIFNEIVLSGVEVQKISKDLELPLYQRHNLGIVPVKFMQNLPKKNFFGGVIGDFYPDLTPVRNIQTLIDHTCEQVWKELIFSRSRAFLDITQQEINQYMQQNWKSGQELQSLLGDYILQANMRTPGATGQKAIEIVKGEFNGNSYSEFLTFLFKMGFKGGGYTFESSNTSAQQTEAETLITQNDDHETTRIKRILYQDDWNEIFRRMFIMEGLDGDTSKWTFTINENQVTDRFKEVELMNNYIAMGIADRQYAVEKLMHMSKDDAQQFLKEISERLLTDKEFMTVLNYEPEPEKETEKSEAVGDIND